MEKFYLVVNINNFGNIQKTLMQMGYRYSPTFLTKNDGTIDISWRDPKEFAIVIEGRFIVGIFGKKSQRLNGLKKIPVEDLILVET